MATPKKKHLIELMIEAGVKWPDCAEYAAQDKDQEPGDRELDLINIVSFYRTKPEKNHGEPFWFGDSDIDDDVKLPLLCHNWHQTIVTREQYADAVAATPMTPATQQETQPSQEYCASVMRQMPDNTIEQLTANYHAKAEEADRLQVVADEALKAAKDALLALQKAGELIGLGISVDTTQKLPMQPEITDWRDLRVGDVIECVTQSNCGRQIECLNWIIGEECQVVKLEEPGSPGQPILAKFKNGEEWWIGKFKFIRRP